MTEEVQQDIKVEAPAATAVPGATQEAPLPSQPQVLPEELSELDDYTKLFQNYQDKFNKVHATSIELFDAEADQRQTLYYYQRRNNAILKLLQNQEAEKLDNPELDLQRIQNLIAQLPRVGRNLTQVTSILSGVADVPIDRSHLLNLYVNESIPELLNDDLSSIEVNPQDINSWTRRNYPSLVESTFRPVYVPSEGLMSGYHGGDVKVLNERVIERTNEASEIKSETK